MAANDKVQNEAEKLGGKAKEAFGRVTGDDSKVVEGQDQQDAASLKQAGENVKDVFR